MQRRSPDEKMNADDFVGDDLFFGAHLYNVSWTAVFKEVTPKLSPARGKFILMVAGTSTVSPLIILTSLIIDNTIDVASDATFHQKVKTFAEEILGQYMEPPQLSDPNANNGPYILLKVLDTDYAKRERFLEVYDGLKKEVDKKLEAYDSNYQNIRSLT